MFSIPNSEKKMLDFDGFEMSPNLVLFDFDNIAPRASFVPTRQSPRHNTSSPRDNSQSPRNAQYAQLNWVPFCDISPKDFEQLICHSSSGSKRKLIDASPKKTKLKKEVVSHDYNLQIKKISTKIVFNTKSATKKRSKT